MQTLFRSLFAQRCLLSLWFVGACARPIVAQTDANSAEERGAVGTAIEPAPVRPKNPLTLWYVRPARQWVEALPLGNGRLGAMVFGGVDQERLQINEDTVWSGSPYDPANSGALTAYPKARELIFAGRQQEAEQVISESGMAIPLGQAPYSTVGDLTIDFANQGAATEYARFLDLQRGVAVTQYRRASVQITREAFSSAPDQVIVVRITADKPQGVSFGATLRSPHRDARISSEGRRLRLQARAGRHADNPGKVEFATIVEVQADNGRLVAQDGRIEVESADAVTLLLACESNFVNWHDLSGDPVARATQRLDAACDRSYDELCQRHASDYQALFNRVSINLGPGRETERPTDERIVRFAEGEDPSLAALFFQYGRYLLMSSSRPGTQPANLQGIWNDSTNPPWGGKYTININTEMNYWPA
ncbi:MAG: glycoside hydrolase family 95 protein, partial [Planctomycetales bacterium]|nr:glycoside hydrolase family 95 protein [Planctomycetales bacterium]